ncbi:LptF/LptG family permease [Sulfurimonas sp. C5]|uniref:LptF/LptG family permease n=1 Tax=Sulfurimonas sp. C5 TaxID=3036947 RepID=UPI0024589D78|nr:LptF/LptG family permease [Sulfurimonas sp. C5]MDH4943796.1 LptF/LptG family permease [Sulfurimonas sp. C5]
MDKLRRYILSNLSSVFLSMFLPLFVIASMIFSIKLATYTAIIKLSLLDMIKLYMFVLPDILFYTLPISFFVAAVLSIFKLSNDNEIVVIFALGIKPSFLVKILFIPAFLLTTLLFIDYLVLYPHTNNLSDNFIDKKKNEAKFNLSASEFGNNFGPWLLYIGKEDKKNRRYEDVLLFNKENNEEILISAKHANVINEDGALQLELKTGQGYSYSEKKFTQINFDEMTIYNSLQSYQRAYKTPLEYWLPKNIDSMTYAEKWLENQTRKTRERLIITNTLLSLFPVLSIFLVVAIGVVHARHQKSKIYLYIFLSIILYYATSMSLHRVLGFHAIYLVTTLWLLGTYYIYRQTITKRF